MKTCSRHVGEEVHSGPTADPEQHTSICRFYQHNSDCAPRLGEIQNRESLIKALWYSVEILDKNDPIRSASPGQDCGGTGAHPRKHREQAGGQLVQYIHNMSNLHTPVNPMRGQEAKPQP